MATTTLKKLFSGQTSFHSVDSDARQNNTAANSKFELCGLTFKFEKLYLRFMFVMADNFVFQNPAHLKLAKR